MSMAQLRGTRASLTDLVKLKYQAKLLPAIPNSKIISNQAGGYLSKLKGRGMEFVESREYQSGDDIRRMDWRLTAKTNKPHTKLFQQEKDRAIYLLIDERSSMQFGTRVAYKSLIGAQIAAMLGWHSVLHGDKLGAIIANGIDNIEIKPRMRTLSMMPLLKCLSTNTLTHGQADLTEALIALRRVITPGSLVFIISDFYNLGQDFQRHLSSLRVHNEIVALLIYDMLEKTPPASGTYQVTDGQQRISFSSDLGSFQQQYQQIFVNRVTELNKLTNMYKIPLVEFATHDIVFDVLRHSLVGGKYG